MSSVLVAAAPILSQAMMASPVIASANPEIPKSAYFLPKPSEPEEKSRLSIQHDSIVLALKGLYPAEAKPYVQAALTNDGPRGQRKILDVGSGNGAWTMDIAREFSHATVLGIDLNPAKPQNLPPNCSFAFGNFSDWNNIDAIKDQKFNVIHSRFTRGSVKDTAKEYDDMSRSLAPGGVLLVGDGNSHIMIKQNGEYAILSPAVPCDPISPRDNIGPDLVPIRSWFVRFMHDFLANVVRERGFPIPVPETYIPSLLENARKSRESAGEGAYEWETVGQKQYYMPIGWNGDEEDVRLGLGKDVGEAVRQTVMLLVRTWRDVSMPGFLATGVPERTVDEWVRRAVEEINDPFFRIYLYLDYSWAVMRAQ